MEASFFLDASRTPSIKGDCPVYEGVAGRKKCGSPLNISVSEMQRSERDDIFVDTQIEGQ